MPLTLALIFFVFGRYFGGMAIGAIPFVVLKATGLGIFASTTPLLSCI